MTGLVFEHPYFFRCLNEYLREGALPYELVYRIVQSREGYVSNKAVKELSGIMMTLIDDVQEQSRVITCMFDRHLMLTELQPLRHATPIVIAKHIDPSHVPNPYTQPIHVAPKIRAERPLGDC